MTPVLGLAEVADHPHVRARGTVIDVDGVPQAAPAPRFSRTASECPTSPPGASTTVDAVLAGWA